MHNLGRLLTGNYGGLVIETDVTRVGSCRERNLGAAMLSGLDACSVWWVERIRVVMPQIRLIVVDSSWLRCVWQLGCQMAVLVAERRRLSVVRSAWLKASE